MHDINTSLQGHSGAQIDAAYSELAGTDGEQVDVPTGYVSDAELMAWLESKSDQQYADLREQMNLSNGRQQLIQKLSDLKADISSAGTPDAVEKVRQEMTDLLNDYPEGTPLHDELSALLGGPLAALDHTQDGSVLDPEAAYGQDGVVLGALKDHITSATDKLGKIDSLALVQIQQLVSDAKETAQLASNVLSSRDQAMSSVIGNIRG